MIQTICIAILIASFLTIAFIFWKKIPFLVKISKNKKNQESDIKIKFKNKIDSLSIRKSSFWSGILVKILSKTKVVILKIENKIEKILQFLRIKNQKDRENGK